MANITGFDRGILQQVRINQARTPTGRFLAFCALLDAARAVAPADPEARDRRKQALRIRHLEREQLREQHRRLYSASGRDVSQSH